MTNETTDEDRAFARGLFSHTESERVDLPELDADRAFARTLFSNDRTTTEEKS
jgi:hypothetical protein